MVSGTYQCMFTYYHNLPDEELVGRCRAAGKTHVPRPQYTGVWTRIRRSYRFHQNASPDRLESSNATPDESASRHRNVFHRAARLFRRHIFGCHLASLFEPTTTA